MVTSRTHSYVIWMAIRYYYARKMWSVILVWQTTILVITELDPHRLPIVLNATSLYPIPADSSQTCDLA